VVYKIEVTTFAPDFRHISLSIKYFAAHRKIGESVVNENVRFNRSLFW